MKIGFEGVDLHSVTKHGITLWAVMPTGVAPREPDWCVTLDEAHGRLTGAAAARISQYGADIANPNPRP